jgi:tRNA(His) 5'-end guanylyltransferase
MKGYESVSKHVFMRRTPLIVRVDGKAFHTFTKGLHKPFDQDLISAMVVAAECVAVEMQGFKAAYIQSDEASFLLTDYDELTTQPWFGYVQAKVVSVAASIMTFAFRKAFMEVTNRRALFDARAFSIPPDEISNYFLWRAQDWKRNSITMYAGAHFSHKQLHKKNQADMHEMLHGIGKNWAKDLSPQIKNGSWLFNVPSWLFNVPDDDRRVVELRYDVLPEFSEIDVWIQKVLPKPD